MNLESIRLQIQAKSAAAKGMFEIAAKLTEQAAALHEGKTVSDLKERAAYYRQLEA